MPYPTRDGLRLPPNKTKSEDPLLLLYPLFGFPCDVNAEHKRHQKIRAKADDTNRAVGGGIRRKPFREADASEYRNYSKAQPALPSIY